jgi:hypothetical protein
MSTPEKGRCPVCGELVNLRSWSPQRKGRLPFPVIATHIYRGQACQGIARRPAPEPTP